MFNIKFNNTEIPLNIDFNQSDEPLNASFELTGGGSSGIPLPEGGNYGDLLAKDSGYKQLMWVTPATAVEQDNTRPITSAAVYTEVGNINALLSLV